MKYWTKRVISLILCVMMLATSIPQQVYADTKLSNISNVSLNVDDTLGNSDEEKTDMGTVLVSGLQKFCILSFGLVPILL